MGGCEDSGIGRRRISQPGYRPERSPHRFAILEQVAAVEGMPCSRLEEHAVLSPATVSHHMKELSEAGLVEIKREGREAYLSLHRPVLDAYLNRLAAL